MRRKRLVVLVCFALAAACAPKVEPPREITIKLIVDDAGAPLANEDVEVRIENPPGGRIVRKTDARGELKVPAEFAGRRAMIATDCRPVCAHMVAPHKLEGERVTINVRAGTTFHDPAQP